MAATELLTLWSILLMKSPAQNIHHTDSPAPEPLYPPTTAMPRPFFNPQPINFKEKCWYCISVRVRNLTGFVTGQVSCSSVV